MALRFVKWTGKDGKVHHLYEKKWALCFPPLILAINIAEAVIRDFQVFSFGLWTGGVVENLWTISGPWNIMNGIAGILNILTICGWFGIIISKDKSRDMIWPDMIWAWIIAYDLWNFAYTYNCISDHSAYCGLALLLACTIPTFFIKKGAWLQHRAQTLALWIMFIMTVPQFADVLAPIPTTHNPTAFFVVSAIALTANIAVAVWQITRIRRGKLNPSRMRSILTPSRIKTSSRRTSNLMAKQPGDIRTLRITGHQKGASVERLTGQAGISCKPPARSSKARACGRPP